MLKRSVPIVAALVLAVPQAANAGPALSISGAVRQPLQLSLAQLRRMRSTVVRAVDPAYKNSPASKFVGVSLWALITKAGVLNAGDKATRFDHVIIAKGSDGYAVTVSIGEIAPAGEDRPVIVAYDRNGTPLTRGPLQLVVPGDRQGWLMVHELATIEVH